ncbi:MAG: hypothetical protein ACAH83_01640 [Alphaproteobacteria bacterium]
MRRMTILWLALAAICSAVLFHTSQQVTDGRSKLNALNADVRKEDESIRVLQAEWSYLNQPDRLEKLSKQYLELAPLKGRQFTKLEDTADRPIPVAEAEAAPEAVTPAAEETPKAAPVVAAEETPKPVVEKVAEKPAAEKPAIEKPAVEKTAAAPIVKFRKPATPPAPVKKAAPVTASGAKSRSFGDLMKSLGVR